jgi:23S rRNA (guanosine2251-2'-O)-methyltransferase
MSEPKRGPSRTREDSGGAASRPKNGAEPDSILPGLKPVCELLERDPARIDMILVRKGRRGPDTDRLLDRCRELKVRFVLADAAAMDRLCAGQGGRRDVAARLADAAFVPLEDLLAQAARAPLPLVLALDQVQDTGNVGTLARSLYALGGAGIIVPRHNGAYLGPGARRAGAGALERLPVAKVANLSHALDEAADRGFATYAAVSEISGSASAFVDPLDVPAVLVLGGEERGVRPLVRQHCGRLLHVPMLRDFDSLNVAQAGGMLLACFLRRHLERGS